MDSTKKGLLRYGEAGLWHDKPQAWHQFQRGVRRRMLATSLTGSLVMYKLEPKSVVPRHSHPHAQFGVCLEGGAVMTVGGTAHAVRRGTSYYVPPAVEHDLVADASSRETVLVESFTPVRTDFLEEALEPDEE